MIQGSNISLGKMYDKFKKLIRQGEVMVIASRIRQNCVIYCTFKEYFIGLPMKFVMWQSLSIRVVVEKENIVQIIMRVSNADTATILWSFCT